jgi:hypothetical protein
VLRVREAFKAFGYATPGGGIVTDQHCRRSLLLSATFPVPAIKLAVPHFQIPVLREQGIHD